MKQKLMIERDFVPEQVEYVINGVKYIPFTLLIREDQVDKIKKALAMLNSLERTCWIWRERNERR